LNTAFRSVCDEYHAGELINYTPVCKEHQVLVIDLEKFIAMTKIKVFKVYRELAWVLIVVGSIIFFYGSVLFVKALISGFNYHFPSGDWISVFFVIQGPITFLMGYFNLRNTKYYIEWDEIEINLFLPRTKNIEKIYIRDIISVNIKLFEIEFVLAGKKRILNLEALQLEDLRKIKDKFESISRQTVS
jgi:hypothetical protein